MALLSTTQIKQVELRLGKLLDDCNAIDASVVATLDGHLVAMRQKANQYSLERLATMGSTLMSLGDTITAELRMGNCENVISENKGGIIAFMHVNKDLVLVSLTTHKNALGMLLSYSRRYAEELAQIVTA
ncbi:hypothetical protein BegalDRAFT_1291 [Beggiatoa alba B18LD]|uniref:Roadblock/LAMTOR2 domain-containing protein n=1 Tax=Beggiatoa alba B18LD TaxID=395493 RepID=I3CEZ5_9GAMM|nr:roadblock/LC7 domain-containing protein [Beggiatoa alba]EIJ42188.1 hypothetical protein BegalDRAFT_1291 [Beggiatoa alba B18LD]